MTRGGELMGSFNVRFIAEITKLFTKYGALPAEWKSLYAAIAWAYLEHICYSETVKCYNIEVEILHVQREFMSSSK